MPLLGRLPGTTTARLRTFDADAVDGDALIAHLDAQVADVTDPEQPR